jgi:MFS family permease
LIFAKFPLVDPNSDKGIKLVTNLFMYAGLVGALVQGATGRLVKLLGEPKLVAISLLLVAVSLGFMPFGNGWPQLLTLLALLSIGSGLTRPPVFGMISNLTPASEQGVTIGVAQGCGSLARILGPIFCATLFYKNPAYPYVICGGVSLVTGAIAWQRLSRNYVPPVTATTQKTAPKVEV